MKKSKGTNRTSTIGYFCTETSAPAGVVIPFYVAETGESPFGAEAGTITLSWYCPGPIRPANTVVARDIFGLVTERPGC